MNQPLPKLSYNVDEATFVLGIKRTKIYELMKTGELRYRLVGSKRLIPHKAIVDFLDSPETA